MVVIKRHWVMEQIKGAILKLVDPHVKNLLQISDFSIATSNRQKLLKKVDDRLEPQDIEKSLGTGMIVVIPKKDLPSDLPFIWTDDPEYNDQKHEIPTVFTDSDFENDSVTMVSEPIPGPSHQPTTTHTITSHEAEFHFDDDFNVMDSYDDNPLENMEEPLTSEDPLLVVFPTLDSESDMFCLDISRDDVVIEMFALYDNEAEDITGKRLSVKFKGEVGVDGGGLLNEVFTIFWKRIFESNDFFLGTDVVVPYIKLFKSRELKPKLVTLGKILGHMLLLTGKIPPSLCLYTLTALSNKTDDYVHNENALLNDFFLFLTLPERNLARGALKDFEKLTTNDKNRLMTLYTTYGLLNVSPNKKDIKEHMLLLAENTIIKNTSDLYKKMKEGLPKSIEEYLSNIPFEDTVLYWKSLQANPKKVVNVLSMVPDTPTNEQDQVFYFLQNYLLGLNMKALQKFLLFVTGSVQLPDKILIDFNTHIGIERRPIVATCAQMLTLSSLYETQYDFNQELDAYLLSEDCFTYDTY
ncbi:unnamed protein product [Brassicogethes aeneus]|uniref:HECT domain-containing protein n=1 Tax=Brassicogethes aeneus TaxID=1431903 RepID=A0A9P0BGZ9_BRAAE|nr:unnamed protein product [Brassicogethes aeneus]